MEINPVVSFNSNTPGDRRRDGGTDVKGGRAVNDVKDIRGGGIKKKQVSKHRETNMCRKIDEEKKVRKPKRSEFNEWTTEGQTNNKY